MNNHVKFMINQLRSIAAICLCLINYQSCFGQEDHGHAEAVSLLSAYISNMEAIRSYDVFLRNESTWVANDELLIREKIAYVRAIVDPEMNRCLAVQRVVMKHAAESAGGQADKPEESVTVAILVNNEGWVRQIQVPDSGIGTFKTKAKLESLLRFTPEVPYLQMIGFSKFPLPYLPDVESLAKGVFAAHRAGTHNMTFDGKSGITVTPSNLSLRSSISFDVFDLVPKSFVYTTATSNKKVCSESFRFETRNGLKLPVRVSGESVGSISVDEKKVVRGVSNYHADLKWFSINEPLDTKLFDIELLKDPQKILALVREDLMDSEK